MSQPLLQATTTTISRMATRITGVMTGNTTTDHDFLAFDDFRIVSVLLWRETTKRLAEAGQFKRDDSIRFLGSST